MQLEEMTKRRWADPARAGERAFAELVSLLDTLTGASLATQDAEEQPRIGAKAESSEANRRAQQI